MPLTAKPRELPHHRTAALRIKLVVGLILFAAALGPIAIIVAASSKSTTPKVRTEGVYASMAEATASDYLAGRSTNLPLAAGVDPMFGREQPANSNDPGVSTSPVPIPVSSMSWLNTTTGTVSKEPYEIDHFLVISQGRRYDLAVTILDSPAGPVIDADPTLTLANIPVVSATAAPQALSYSSLGGKQQNAPNSAISQVDAWASAFVSNNQKTLYLLSGDTQPATFYGLQGWNLLQATVLQSVVSGNDALIQVQLQMQTNTFGTAAPVTATSTYDVLESGIQKNAQPDVVAWGPAGSGPTLYPYMNANVGAEPPQATTSTTSGTGN